MASQLRTSARTTSCRAFNTLSQLAHASPVRIIPSTRRPIAASWHYACGEEHCIIVLPINPTDDARDVRPDSTRTTAQATVSVGEVSYRVGETATSSLAPQEITPAASVMHFPDCQCSLQHCAFALTSPSFELGREKAKSTG